MKEIDEIIEKNKAISKKDEELEILIKKAFSLRNRTHIKLHIETIIDLVMDCLQLEYDMLIVGWLNQIKQKLEEML